MSSAVMLSIRPEWCELIADRSKRDEVRKTKPNIQTPFKCYIYCTSARGAGTIPRGYNWRYRDAKGEFLVYGERFSEFLTGYVIGEFVCDDIHAYPQGTFPTDFALSDMCMKGSQFHKYRGYGTVYGWHISDLVIYDTPKTLQEFGITMPPQSWRYVEEET